MAFSALNMALIIWPEFFVEWFVLIYLFGVGFAFHSKLVWKRVCSKSAGAPLKHSDNWDLVKLRYCTPAHTYMQQRELQVARDEQFFKGVLMLDLFQGSNKKPSLIFPTTIHIYFRGGGGNLLFSVHSNKTGG